MKNKQKSLTIAEMQDLVFDCMKYIHEFCVNNNITYYMIGGTLLGAIRSKNFIPWDEDADIAMVRDDYEKFYNFKDKFDNDKYFIELYRDNKHTYCFHMRVCVRNTLINHKNLEKKYGRQLQVDVFPLDTPPTSTKWQSKQIKIFNRINKILYFKSVGYSTVLLTNIKRIFAKLFLVFYSTKNMCKKADLTARFAFHKEKDNKYLVSMASHYPYSKQLMEAHIYGHPKLYSFRDTTFYGVEEYDLYLQKIYGNDYMTPRKEQSELKAEEKSGLLIIE